jgi:hypothetical protein
MASMMLAVPAEMIDEGPGRSVVQGGDDRVGAGHDRLGRRRAYAIGGQPDHLPPARTGLAWHGHW